MSNIQLRTIQSTLMTKNTLLWMKFEIPKKGFRTIKVYPRSEDFPTGSVHEVHWTDEKSPDGKRLYRLELRIPEINS